MPLLILMFVLGAAGLATLMMAFLQGRQGSSMDDRLAAFTEGSATLEQMELQLPFRQRVLAPGFKGVLNLVGKLGPGGQNAGKIKRNLELAGSPNGITPSMFVGIRMVLAIVLLGLFYLLTRLANLPPINMLLYTMMGGAMGYIMPGIWLDRKIKARKHNIRRSLPDALDLLTISVEAGLGFDLALQRVADKWDNELSKEFKRMLSDTRLGISRRDAMRTMADRCGVDELSAFISAILQAEQLGASFGKILKVQSEQMRIKRRQRAEELAHQAPIKMLFPMAFLIFPSILVVILGPALPTLMGGGISG